jgi:hypothetical protein
MRFTLTYRGPLLGSKSGVMHKHEVRRALHPQLCELWRHEPLSHRSDDWLRPTPGSGGPEAQTALVDVAGHSFAVLVRARLKLVAELDVLLLRPEAPGGILLHADIDNRLKTLFDALRCPGTAQELPAGYSPSDDERPLHCLLEDDRLITRVNVETDRLLAARSQDEVHVTIRVQLRAWSPTYNSVMLIS